MAYSESEQLTDLIKILKGISYTEHDWRVDSVRENRLRLFVPYPRGDFTLPLPHSSTLGIHIAVKQHPALNWCNPRHDCHLVFHLSGRLGQELSAKLSEQVLPAITLLAGLEARL